MPHCIVIFTMLFYIFQMMKQGGGAAVTVLDILSDKLTQLAKQHWPTKVINSSDIIDISKYSFREVNVIIPCR